MATKKTGLVLLVITILCGLFYLGSQFYKKQEVIETKKADSKNEKHLVRDHSPSIGSSMMKVHLVEFLDPECEACAFFHPIIKGILKKYEGSIYYVVRYAPFHPNSKFAIKVLDQAKKQGKYWQTLDVLFANVKDWGDHHHPQPEKIWGYLPDIGLDVDKIKQEMENKEVEALIAQEIKDVETFDIRQTPTFFLNGERLSFRSAEELEQQIKSYL